MYINIITIYVEISSKWNNARLKRGGLWYISVDV